MVGAETIGGSSNAAKRGRSSTRANRGRGIRGGGSGRVRGGPTGRPSRSRTTVPAKSKRDREESDQEVRENLDLFCLKLTFSIPSRTTPRSLSRHPFKSSFLPLDLEDRVELEVVVCLEVLHWRKGDHSLADRKNVKLAKEMSYQTTNWRCSPFLARTASWGNGPLKKQVAPYKWWLIPQEDLIVELGVGNTDPKNIFYEKASEYLSQHGYTRTHLAIKFRYAWPTLCQLIAEFRTRSGIE